MKETNLTAAEAATMRCEVIISMNKTALLESLEKQLALAIAEDARAAAQHKIDEAKALSKFRDRLKRVLKMDYGQIKKARKDYDFCQIKFPSCPMLEQNFIRREIACVKSDTRKGNYRIPPGSDLYRAIMWVPASKRDKQSVCD